MQYKMFISPNIPPALSTPLFVMRTNEQCYHFHYPVPFGRSPCRVITRAVKSSGRSKLYLLAYWINDLSAPIFHFFPSFHRLPPPTASISGHIPLPSLHTICIKDTFISAFCLVCKRLLPSPTSLLIVLMDFHHFLLKPDGHRDQPIHVHSFSLVRRARHLGPCGPSRIHGLNISGARY